MQSPSRNARATRRVSLAHEYCCVGWGWGRECVAATGSSERPNPPFGNSYHCPGICNMATWQHGHMVTWSQVETCVVRPRSLFSLKAVKLDDDSPGASITIPPTTHTLPPSSLFICWFLSFFLSSFLLFLFFCQTVPV